MTSSLPNSARHTIEHVRRERGLVVWLTGAGISAESGVPTFRGEEGYWRVGSRNYHPQELATRSAFEAMPDEVWTWYLYRRGVCRRALPNAAHGAVAELERSLADRFVLVTQNVDGLHLRAGNTMSRTFQIHGNIDYMRCAEDCSDAISPLPDAIDVDWPKERALTAGERARLACVRCGAPGRPHVLWFDETYDEPKFRFESSLGALERACVLLVVGTAGATTLPNHLVRRAVTRGIPIVVIDREDTAFSELAQRAGGVFLRGTACSWVPALCHAISSGP